MEQGQGAADPTWTAIVEQSPLGETLGNSVWLYPAVETLHILGFAILVGAIVTFDLRVIAARPGLELGPWARAILPVARAGFALALPMGLLLFVTDATAYLANPAFRLKLVMLALALANVGAFHLSARDRDDPSTALRVFAVLSLATWVCVLTLGRLIAYV